MTKLMLLLFLFLPQADISATTEDGKAVTLHPDGTWEYANDTDSDWKTIKSWSGDGIKETETFQAPSGEWRIWWDLKTEGLLQIMVYQGDNAMPKIVSNTTTIGSGDSFLRTSGPHHLTINAMGQWTVKVQEKR